MVTVCEQLGDIVGFSATEVRVLKELYDLIDGAWKEDFDTVLETANSRYQSDVKLNKERSLGRSPSQIKKQVVAEVIQPFLDLHGLANFKRIRNTVSGTPTMKEKKVTVARKPSIVDMKIDSEEVADLFDNYDWSIDESKPSEELETLEEDPFGFGELFEDENNEIFDFNNLI